VTVEYRYAENQIDRLRALGWPRTGGGGRARMKEGASAAGYRQGRDHRGRLRP
jgi:hypothetical protein